MKIQFFTFVASFIIALLPATFMQAQSSPCLRFPGEGFDHSQSLGVVELRVDLLGGVTETVYFQT